MCNRVATPTEDEIQGYFDKEVPGSRHLVKIDPFKHYFYADGFEMPRVPFEACEEPFHIKPAMWKLLPHWVKNQAEGYKYANTLNARSEEIFEKPTYKNNIIKNRGIMWVAGFFEPYHPRAKVTIPYLITRKDRLPIPLGCVYNNWTDQDSGEVIRTVSIITTDSNPYLSTIHNEGLRMPVIVTPDKRDQWFNARTRAEIEEMFNIYNGDDLQGWPVGNYLNKRGVEKNTPQAFKRVEYPDFEMP